jgi:hypothetical protein
MTLVDRVLKQIEQDVANQDFTAIEELLQFVPEHILEGFISESFDDFDDSFPLSLEYDEGE